MRKLVNQFLRSGSGATAVEYAVLATCVALAIIAAVAYVGTQVNSTYTNISNSFN